MFTMLKMLSVLLLLSLSVTLQAGATRPLDVRVVSTTDSTAIPYATVFVNDCDGRYVDGGVTDESGEWKAILNDSVECANVSVSVMGYTSLTLPWEQNTRMCFSLSPDSHVLKEVEVTAQKDFVKNSPTGLLIDMNDNPATLFPNAVEAIKQLPLVDPTGNGLSIIGNNNTVIYVNRRKIKELNELNIIAPGDIESVEIITSPGIKYGNADGVIIIRTKKLPAGYGVRTQGNGILRPGASEHNENLQLTYNAPSGWSVLGAMDYIYTNTKTRRDNTEIAEDIYRTFTHGKTHTSRKNLTPTAGVFYDSKKWSAGIKYNFARVPSSHTEGEQEFDVARNGESPESGNVRQISASQSSRHWVNGYFNMDIDQSSDLSVTADYYKGMSKSGSEVHQMLLQQAMDYNSLSKADYSLFSADIDYSKKWDKVNFEVGAFFSGTDNENTFLANYASHGESVNRQEQTMAGGYASLGFSIGNRWSIRGGLRYEHTGMDYYLNHKKDDDYSSSRHAWLPNLSVTFADKGLYLTLSTFRRTYRPQYSYYSNNYTFISPTLWQTGNPLLKEIHNTYVNLTAMYKKSYLQVEAVWSKNRFDYIYRYDPELGMAITQPVSIPSMRSLSIIFQQRYDLGIWSSTLVPVVLFQHARYGTPSSTFNKPLFQCFWTNRFTLPWQLYASTSFQLTCGGNTNLYKMHPTNVTSLTLNRRFGNWTVSLSATDIFNTYHKAYTIRTNGMSYTTDQFGMTQQFSVSVTYQLEKRKKEYRSKGTSSSEIDRL